MISNIILDTDSYKASHWKQYPPGTTAMYSYLESRGGVYGATLFFGLQGLMQEYLTTPVTIDDVNEAEEVLAKHGLPFNKEGWSRIVNKFGGYLPVTIKAVPEGLIVPTGNILMSVESNDPETFWVVSWLETKLMRLWYPITVATQSRAIRDLIMKFLIRTADNPEHEIGFKLHDFGSRGVSSRESAGIGGAAHLINFQGSDTIEGIMYAREHYGADMAGFSIPASEHSSITSWGEAGEIDAYRNMITQFGGRNKVVACVSDSYDYYNAVEHIWCRFLKDTVKDSGTTLVIRPDSGDPATIVSDTLKIIDSKLGLEKNSKGFKVLPPYFRIIQGDGVSMESISAILGKITNEGYSASNVGFGMGGALLQQVNRDTQKFAFKCSEVTVNGTTRPVYKTPKTDPGKVSKKGRLSLIKTSESTFETVGSHQDDILRTVYENGRIVNVTDFDHVREIASQGMAIVQNSDLEMHKALRKLIKTDEMIKVKRRPTNEQIFGP